MKESYAIMHTPVRGYYWRNQGNYSVFDPSPYDFLIRGNMDQATAEQLVAVATESGIEVAKATWKLLK